MAKLSLWLVTLDKNRPFTFLNHALKCGDSLVGVDLDQLTTWSLAGEGERRFETMTIQAQIDQMVKIRRQLEAIPVNSIADQEYKQQLFEHAERLAHDLRRGGDMLIGSYFNDLGKEEQEYLRTALLLAFRDGQDVPPDRAKQADLGNLRPFHWPLEFSEVFFGEDRKGFDAFVGNPPFLGGKRISTTYGEIYNSYLRNRWSHAAGAADLCTYFFLRTFENLNSMGNLGLIATNTIAQGGTREVGLDYLLKQDATIYRATNNQPWSGQAAVVVSVVHAAKGLVKTRLVLDGAQVQHISSLLDSTAKIGEPYRLASNKNKAFVGSFVMGKGFILTEEEAKALIAKNPHNKEVLFPYLVGQDLNSSPDQSASRWVIDFHDWSYEKASQYPDCLQILTERVKPYRDEVVAQGKQIHEYDYWKFWDKRLESYALIAGMKNVIVIALTSRTGAFALVPTDIVFSHMVGVFASEDAHFFAILQSNFHIDWAWKYGSSLKGDLRYTPSDIFETFPFPQSPHEVSNLQSLETLGETYHEHRRQLMLDRQEGLTKTYNRFHDPEETAADIVKLRELHVEMDQAVAAAYGWADLALGHAFHETPQGLRYTISEPARREVLGRLLALNHERYEAEKKAGLHDAKRKKKGGGRKTKSKRSKSKGTGAVSGRQSSLPGLEDDRPQQLGLFGEEEDEAGQTKDE
jgi:hypothetical protein